MARCCVGTRGASPPIMVEGIMGAHHHLNHHHFHCAPVGSEFSVLYCGCTKIAPRVAGVHHGNVSESTGLEVLRVQL